MAGSPTQKKEVDPTCEVEVVRSTLPKFVLVLLHGLTMDASETDKIKEAAEEAFGEDVFVIQPKCREGLKSAYTCIQSQAKQVAAEVKAALRDKYPDYNEKELQELKISLFGFSQGGLVACAVASDYGSDFNVKAIITGHSPLSGTEALENTVHDVKSFKSKAKPGLNAIGHPDSFLVNSIMFSWLSNGFGVNKLTKVMFKGLSDMRREAACIERIKKFIRENKNGKGEQHGIPILLVGGYVSNLGECFDYDKDLEAQVQDFNKLYASLATLDKNGEHDILVSMRSQLCRGPSFENINASGNDPVYPKNVTTHVVKDQLHCWNLAAVLSDYNVQYGKTLFENDESVAFVIEYLKKQNLSIPE